MGSRALVGHQCLLLVYMDSPIRNGCFAGFAFAFDTTAWLEPFIVVVVVVVVLVLVFIYLVDMVAFATTR